MTGLTAPASRRRQDSARGTDVGQVTAFVVVLTAGLLLLAGLVLDGGLALAGKVRAIDEAQEAARAGAQQIDLAIYRAQNRVVLDPARAAASAQRYLAGTGDTGTVTVVGDSVTVTVTHRQATQLLRLAGVNRLLVTGHASVRLRRGITTEDQ
jgi:hypothetical protein